MKYSVKITNLSFELEFQPIWEIDPPKPEKPIEPEKPPVVTPMPPIIELPNEVFDLDAYLDGKEGVVRLPDAMKGKEVVMRSKGWIKPNKVTELISTDTIPTFENWEVTPEQLFDLEGCTQFGIKGITPVCPPNRPIKTACPPKALFGWKPDTVSHGKFAFVGGQEITDKERMTFGLSRFAYSSNSDQRIYLIAKNMWHNGYVFTEAKNNYNGNLWLIFQDVNVHNPITIDQGGADSAPSSMFYTPTRIQCRISVKDGIATILSDNTFDQILTHWGYDGEGVTSILHFDRYAYKIWTDNVIDSKTLALELPEGHPLDIINGYGTIVEKQINPKRSSGFDYIFDRSTKDEPTSITLPEGEFDAFIVYKGNALFSLPITKDTYFDPTDYWGSGVVTNSQGYGWTWYNHVNSGYMERFRGLGYFRNSGGSERIQGLTIRDCYFQKNAPTATENKDMPLEAKQYIEYLESLT